MNTFRQQEVWSASLKLVAVLEANSGSLRRPNEVPEALWAPRRGNLPYVSKNVSRLVPYGLPAALEDLDVKIKNDLAIRLHKVGLRNHIIKSIFGKYNIRDASGEGNKVDSSVESGRTITGRMPSAQQIFRYADHATYANSWSDIFYLSVCSYAIDATTVLEAFIESWELYNLIIDQPPEHFDITDAWVVSKLEIDGELEVLPCRHSGSTFVRPSGKDARTPWRVRRDGVLPLSQRIIAYIIAKELTENNVRAAEVEPTWREVKRSIQDRQRVRRNRF